MKRSNSAVSPSVLLSHQIAWLVFLATASCCLVTVIFWQTIINPSQHSSPLWFWHFKDQLLQRGSICVSSSDSCVKTANYKIRNCLMWRLCFCALHHLCWGVRMSSFTCSDTSKCFKGEWERKIYGSKVSSGLRHWLNADINYLQKKRFFLAK